MKLPRRHWLALPGKLLLSLALLCPFPLLADAPIRVACVGASVTYGFGLNDRVHECYPAWLGRWLGSGYDVRNFGKSGTTLMNEGDYPYSKQEICTEALAFKPDLVIILIGANDSKHPGPGSLDTNNVSNNWQYKDHFVPDYESLITKFRQANPTAKIYACYPTPCFPGRWGINDNTIHYEILPLIHQVAAESKVNVIDLYDTFSRRKDLFPDTVHPNAEGAKLMATAIYISLTGKNPPTVTPP